MFIREKYTKKLTYYVVEHNLKIRSKWGAVREILANFANILHVVWFNFKHLSVTWQSHRYRLRKITTQDDLVFQELASHFDPFHEKDLMDKLMCNKRSIRTISGLTSGDFCEIPVVVTLHLEVEYFALGIASLGDQVLIQESLQRYKCR